MTPKVAAECEQCGHIIKVPGCTLSVSWNCPACSKANQSHPVASARYQRRVGQ